MGVPPGSIRSGQQDLALSRPCVQNGIMATLDTLLKLVGTPRDGALLRFSLGNEWMRRGDAAQAIPHLREAVARDPNYSAAWKLLGKALAEAGQPQEALASYRAGIAVAEAKGDIQAAKEMKVFARRLERAADPGDRPNGDPQA